MPELKDLLNAVYCKASKWYVIGLNLDLSTDELDTIDEDGHTVEERMRKMLKKCLTKKNPPLTWTALIEALRQPAVGEEVLASMLEKRYLPNDNDFKSQRPIISKQEPFCHESKTEDGIPRLEEMYRTIGVKLARTMKQNEVTVDEMQIYAATLPVSVRKQYQGMMKRPSLLTKVTGVYDFIETVNTYSNILNPNLLEDAVKKFGNEETNDLMADYMKMLSSFRKKTKLGDLMGKWKAETPPSYHRLFLVMGDNWKEKTLEEFEEVRHESWLLEMVVEGSIIVVISIPEPIDLEAAGFNDFLRRNDILSARIEVNHPQDLEFDEGDMLTAEAKQHEEISVESVHMSVAPSRSKSADKAMIELKITNLRAQFKDLLMNFRQDLVQTGVTVETLEEYVDHLPLTVNQHYKDLMKQPSSLTDIATAHVDCFIDALTTYTFILNPTLLNNAIAEYGNERTKEDASTCMRNLEEFQKSTKLGDLVDVWSGEPPPNHKQVVIESGWEDKMLYDLIQILVTARAFGWHLLQIDRKDIGLKVVFSAQQPVSISKSIQDFLRPYGVSKIQLEGESVIDLEAPPVDVSPKEEKAFILPDVIQFGFHPVTGQNIILSENGLEAERKDYEDDFNTSVYSAKPFEGTAEFEVEITKLRQSVFGGTLQVGLKWLKSGTEIVEENIPRWSVEGDDYCIWYYGEIWNNFRGDLQKSRYGKLSPNEIQQGGTLGMRVSRTGELTFIVNGRNQGVAAKNMYRKGYDTYAVLDIRRRCFAVKITRAVMRSGDVTLQELCIEEIARSVKSSEQVKELPLPKKLKKELEKYVAEHTEATVAHMYPHQ